MWLKFGSVTRTSYLANEPAIIPELDKVLKHRNWPRPRCVWFLLLYVSLILLLLLAGSLQFQNFTFNYRKRAKKKSRKSSNIVQLADGVTAVAQLYALYSHRARSFNQWQHALYPNFIINWLYIRIYTKKCNDSLLNISLRYHPLRVWDSNQRGHCSLFLTCDLRI